MFENSRMSAWERIGGDHVKKWSPPSLSSLSVCEDCFIPHPKTKASVVLREPIRWGEANEIIREQRFCKINHGFAQDGLVFNFRTENEAILFRMFYSGMTV